MTIKKSKEGLTAVRAQHPDDHYATPVSLAYMALASLRETLDNPAPFLYDTGVGDFGVFGFAARKIWPDAFIAGDDLRPVTVWPWYDKVVTGHNFETDSLFDPAKGLNEKPAQGWPDAFIGNPPFSRAEAFVRRAAKVPDSFVFYLLRLAFAESKSRAVFFDRYKPLGCLVCRKRPSWWLYNTLNAGKRSTNSTAYAFYSWGGATPNPTQLTWLDWDYLEDLEDEFKANLRLKTGRLAD